MTSPVYQALTVKILKFAYFFIDLEILRHFEGEIKRSGLFCRSLLLSIPLLVVDTKQDETEAIQLRDICMNYLVNIYF